MSGDLVSSINQVGQTGLDMTTGLLTGTLGQYIGFGIAIGVIGLAIYLFQRFGRG